MSDAIDMTKCATQPCDDAPAFTFKKHPDVAASMHACAKHAAALLKNGLVLVGKIPTATFETEVDDAQR